MSQFEVSLYESLQNAQTGRKHRAMAVDQQLVTTKAHFLKVTARVESGHVLLAPLLQI